jgi:hypothetical protein
LERRGSRDKENKRNGPAVGNRRGGDLIRRRIFIISFFASGVLWGLAGHAADRYVAPTGTDTGGCLDSGNPCRTIQYAVDASGANDTIHVAAGSYVENITIDVTLALSGAGASVTTVDGSRSGPVVSVMIVPANSGTAAISGMTLTNGSECGILSSESSLVVTDCVISGNDTTNEGGAIYAWAGAPVPSLTIRNTTVADNSAMLGGGIASRFGSVLVENCTVSGNTAQLQGGGIANWVGSSMTVVNSTVSGNAGGQEGGIANDGTLTLINTTITGNTSQGGPGGGVESSDGATTLRNTLIAGNQAPSGPDCSGTLQSEGYNLIEDTNGCALSGDLTGNITGQDPHLGPLADNTGPTKTHALLPGSPAIDAGDPAGCIDQNGAPLLTDQRGVLRPVDCGGGMRCDIGAIEAYCGTGPPTVYESVNPDMAGAAAVGTASSSPYDHAPGAGPEYYYKLDDGHGIPAVIHIVKGGLGILIYF